VLFLCRSIELMEGGEPGTDLVRKPIRQEVLFRSLGALLGRMTGPGSSSSHRVPKDRHSFAPARGTVLAAEDNPTNQEVLRALLDELGYTVDIHRNGVEAIRAFMERRDYACVLMDCQMPELDGYRAAERIRETEKREKRSRVPILAITAGTPADVRSAVLAAGMDEVLPKPLELESLKDALARFCPSVEPVLDPARTTELLRLQTHARPTFYRDLVARFVADADPLVASLHGALEDRDAERLKDAAHALKGSSRNLGARLLSAVCEGLERQASEGRLDGAATGIARVVHELERASGELERLAREA
jgi:CheY-like chemotaxis protein